MKQRVFLVGFLGGFFWCCFFFFPCLSSSANVGVTSPLEVFQLPFSNGESLVLLPLHLAALFQVNKM